VEVRRQAADYGAEQKRRTVERVTLNNASDYRTNGIYQFGFKLPSELIPNQTSKFMAKLQASDSV